LFPLLSYKKFASPGEKEKEAKLLTVPKEFRAIATRATQQEMSAPRHTSRLKSKLSAVKKPKSQRYTDK
jgi:hypothetical protein